MKDEIHALRSGLYTLKSHSQNIKAEAPELDTHGALNAQALLEEVTYTKEELTDAAISQMCKGKTARTIAEAHI